MRRLYTKLVTLVLNGWFWILDYVYVAYWQLYGFLIRTRTERYKAGIKTPIVLIPGIYENWRFMKPIADMLFALGHPVHMVTALGYNTGAIEQMADYVTTYIRTERLEKCIIIAHSKGGLIAKQVIGFDQASFVLGAITINTPFAGSKYASLFPLKSIRVFSPDSKILTTLANNTLPNARIVSIYGIFDPHIPLGSYLEGSRNIQLSTRGHFRILNNKRVHETIEASINDFIRDV